MCSWMPHLLEPSQACCAGTGLVGKGLRQLNDGNLGAGLQVPHHGWRVDLLQDRAHLVIKPLHSPAARCMAGHAVQRKLGDETSLRGLPDSAVHVTNSVSQASNHLSSKLVWPLQQKASCKMTCIASRHPFTDQHAHRKLLLEEQEKGHVSSPTTAQASYLLQDDMQRPEHPGDAAHARPEILDLPLRQPPRAWLACKDKTPCDLLVIGLDLATAHA